MRKTHTESTKRRIWVIRAGRKSSPQRCKVNEDGFFLNGIAGLVDDYRLGDLRDGKRTKDELCSTVSSNNPEMHSGAVATVVSNLTKLASDMKIGEWVICPSRLEKVYRVGVLNSGYRFDTKSLFQHFRGVKWIGGIAKDSLSIEAQRELGAARLFFECKRSCDEIASLIEPLLQKVSSK